MTYTLEIGTNFTSKTIYGDLDLLGYVEPIGEYEQLAGHQETYDLGQFSVRTISLEGLIRVKIHINGPKDQESIMQLHAIKRIRDEGSNLKN